MLFLILFCLLLGSPAIAQERIPTQKAQGAILRSLDRITGEVQDHRIQTGQEFTRAKLTVTVNDCRYPQGAIDDDAFVQLEIIDNSIARPVFSGWMIASSPALSALEHPRYDVWVLKCITS